MLEKRSHESIVDSLPHTVNLISMPSAANGKRGLSVSVMRDVNGTASVQVKECVSWKGAVVAFAAFLSEYFKGFSCSSSSCVFLE